MDIDRLSGRRIVEALQRAKRVDATLSQFPREAWVELIDWRGGLFDDSSHVRLSRNYGRQQRRFCSRKRRGKRSPAPTSIFSISTSWKRADQLHTGRRHIDVLSKIRE